MIGVNDNNNTDSYATFWCTQTLHNTDMQFLQDNLTVKFIGGL